MDNRYTLQPVGNIDSIVIERPISVREESFGTVPYTTSHLMLKVITDMDKEFSEMTEILRSRNKAPWRK